MLHKGVSYRARATGKSGLGPFPGRVGKCDLAMVQSPTPFALPRRSLTPREAFCFTTTSASGYLNS